MDAKLPEEALKPLYDSQRWDGSAEGGQDRTGQHGIAYQMKLMTRPFTRLHQIPVVRRIWVFLAFTTAYVCLVAWIIDQNFPSHQFKEAGASAFTSAIMGLLLVFRTNTAYERWSEGRKLWGQLTNDTRNLCLKVRNMVDVPDAEKNELGELVISFAYALKHHLRGTRPQATLPGITPAACNTVKNLPVYITNKIFALVTKWQKNDRMPGMVSLQIDVHTRAYMDICGACERIRSTPLAISYRAFMRQGIVFNLIALPWYVIPELQLAWGLPIILIGAYFLLGLELIAENIEDPFGQDGDDLPLDTLCDNIRQTVSDIFKSEKKMQQFTVSNLAPIIDPLKDTTEVRKPKE